MWKRGLVPAHYRGHGPPDELLHGLWSLQFDLFFPDNRHRSRQCLGFGRNEGSRGHDLVQRLNRPTERKVGDRLCFKSHGHDRRGWAVTDESRMDDMGASRNIRYVKRPVVRL